MKRIALLAILIFITGIMFSCSDSSSSDTDEGYIDPEISAKTQAEKSYSVGGETCSSDTACGAILYKGELDDVDYVGFAIDNYLTGASKFSLKIYWEANSYSNPMTTDFSAKVIDGSNTYTTHTGTLDISITQSADASSVTVYIIHFNQAITIDGFSISAGDEITAYGYSD